jgi:cytidylate kinase
VGKDRVDLVVTISGLHGTGKTTYAAELAARLNLRHVSAGRLFRDIARERNRSLSELSLDASQKEDIDLLVDKRIVEEANVGNVVIDGLLAGWMTRNIPGLKIYLFASENVRLERIARRDGCSIQESRRETLFREELERRRFKKFYGIDLDDLSIYDLILNTGLLSPEGNIHVLESFVRTYMNEHEVK